MPLHSKEIVINECDKTKPLGFRATSQIHDGFATIRARGQQRNRIRIKQMEASKFNKCDSMPIYEGSSSIGSNSSVSSKRRDISSQSTSEIDRSIFCKSTNNLPNKHSSGYVSTNTCYENALNALELIPNVEHGVGDSNYFLYARPTSPTTTNAHVIRPANAENNNGAFASYKYMEKRPPPYSFKKPNLQYRKSLSNSSHLMHENFETNFYNSDTNYYDPSNISYTSHDAHKSSAKSSDNLNLDIESVISNEPNGYERRRYATLSHPRDTQIHHNNLQHQRLHSKYVTNQFSASQTDVEYIDPIDYKVGCQTTLRSKPQIPWYELAIRKTNRRLSCPPMQVLIESIHKILAFHCKYFPHSCKFNE